MNGIKSNRQLKKGIFALILILLPILFIEIILRFSTVEYGHTLRLLDRPWYTIPPLDTPDSTNFIKQNITNPNGYRIYDSLLGWKINKNGKAPPYYYSSSSGFRITKDDYQKNLELKKANIITIGNSFTHGDEVYCEESWPYIYGQLSNKTVINLGVPGYGIDQAILSYKYSSIQSDTIILGIIPGDFERATKIVYRGIYYGGKKSKPMFYFNNDGSYKIKNQPCLVGMDLWNEFSLGLQSDFFKTEKIYDDVLFKKEPMNNFMSYRIYKMFKYRNNYIKEPIYLKNTVDNNYDYILKIFKVFYNECKKNKDFPMILLLDNNNTFSDRKKYDRPWEMIIKDLKAMGFFVIEPLDSLVSMHNNEPGSIINSNGVHYTPLANEMIARYILQIIDGGV